MDVANTFMAGPSSSISPGTGVSSDRFTVVDPSAAICESYDSLKQEGLGRLVFDPQSWFRASELGAGAVLQFAPAAIGIDGAPVPEYCDPDRYRILQQIKDAFDVDVDIFTEARNAMNPFEAIGKSIFINRAAVKLANIDAVHYICNTIFTFDRPQSDRPLVFCDIAAGPGGFTQYLQYRFPNAVGYGMTLKQSKLNWSTKFLDMTRFTPFYGPDDTGDLYTNWRPFIEYVLQHQTYGADLVTADGGFDLEDSQDKTLLHRQEFLSSRLLLTQATVGVACTKAGGTFVLKVFDTVTHFSAQILFVLAQCFQEILIFKPVTSRPANAERYVICRNRHGDINVYLHLLAYAAASYQDTIYLNQLFAEPLPTPFTTWLTRSNTTSINYQLESARNILLYLQGTPPTIPTYLIDKFLIIWNLPDTPPTRQTPHHAHSTTSTTLRH